MSVDILDRFDVQELWNELGRRHLEGEKVLPPEPEFREVTAEVLFEALLRKEQTIYGIDNRIDVGAGVAGFGAVPGGVAAVFDQDLVKANGDGTSRLVTGVYGQTWGLCETERFFNQPCGAWCTAFLVSPQIIVSAGHAIKPTTFQNFRFVFGYQIITGDVARLTIPDDQIYRGARLIGWSGDLNTSGDWVVIELDRPVTGHRYLEVRRSGKIADGQRVSVFGYPRGLPLKFAGGAEVRENTHENIFVANLDTYTGNSGSPVLNDDHEVEGILVWGQRDFVPLNGCLRSHVCPVNLSGPDCAGERCMRITKLAHLIP